MRQQDCPHRQMYFDQESPAPAATTQSRDMCSSKTGSRTAPSILPRTAGIQAAAGTGFGFDRGGFGVFGGSGGMFGKKKS